jgi:uncharacterized protein YjlB
VQSDGPDDGAPRVLNILSGEATGTRATAFGEVGTIFRGQEIECVWVRKGDEQIDPGWFESDRVDLMLVVQGALKVEFEAEDYADRILRVGDVLVLPAGVRCRAYRWPRNAPDASIFVAAYPTGR